MRNICKKIDDYDNTCDLIAAGAQIALFITYVSDGQMLTAKNNLYHILREA